MWFLIRILYKTYIHITHIYNQYITLWYKFTYTYASNFFQTNDNIKSHVQSLKIANIMKRKKKNTSKRNYDSKIPTKRSSYQNPRLRVEPKRLESSWNLLAGHSRGNKRRKRGAREKEEKSASRVRKREIEVVVRCTTLGEASGSPPREWTSRSKAGGKRPLRAAHASTIMV